MSKALLMQILYHAVETHKFILHGGQYFGTLKDNSKGGYSLKDIPEDNETVFSVNYHLRILWETGSTFEYEGTAQVMFRKLLTRPSSMERMFQISSTLYIKIFEKMAEHKDYNLIDSLSRPKFIGLDNDAISTIVKVVQSYTP